MNISEQLEKHIKEEVNRIKKIKNEGKSCLYMEGEYWAYLNVLKMAEQLDEYDIEGMSKQFKAAMVGKVWK